MSVPFGFASDMMEFVMSAGHLALQTMCCFSSFVSFVHTPPAPVLLASVYAMNHGIPGVSSSIDVGLVSSKLRRNLHSFMLCLMLFVMVMKSDVVCRPLYMADSRLAPSGMPMLACTSFPAIFWKSCRVIVFFFAACFSIVLKVSIFVDGSFIEYSLPLKIHPRISFSLSHLPSPWLSFLMDTGSPPVWPVTDGGGKMECTPCRIALDQFVRFSVLILLVMAMKSST